MDAVGTFVQRDMRGDKSGIELGSRVLCKGFLIRTSVDAHLLEWISFTRLKCYSFLPMLQLTFNLRCSLYSSLKTYRQISKVSVSKFSARTSPATDMETVHTTERLQSLRKLMKEQNVDVYSVLYTVTCWSTQSYNAFSCPV